MGALFGDLPASETGDNGKLYHSLTELMYCYNSLRRYLIAIGVAVEFITSDELPNR